jgi:hypothetical protein
MKEIQLNGQVKKIRLIGKPFQYFAKGQRFWLAEALSVGTMRRGFVKLNHSLIHSVQKLTGKHGTPTTYTVDMTAHGVIHHANHKINYTSRYREELRKLCQKLHRSPNRENLNTMGRRN